MAGACLAPAGAAGKTRQSGQGADGSPRWRGENDFLICFSFDSRQEKEECCPHLLLSISQACSAEKSPCRTAELWAAERSSPSATRALLSRGAPAPLTVPFRGRCLLRSGQLQPGAPVAVQCSRGRGNHGPAQLGPAAAIALGALCCFCLWFCCQRYQPCCVTQPFWGLPQLFAAHLYMAKHLYTCTSGLRHEFMRSG